MTKHLLAIISLTALISFPAKAQDTIPLPKKTEKFHRIKKVIDILFYDIDTTYIESDKYRLNLSLKNTNWFDTYYLRSNDESNQSITLSQKPSYNIGAYIGWEIITVGWSLNILDTFTMHKDTERKTEFDLSLIGTFIGCDMYYRHFKNGFKINHTQGIIDNNTISDYEGEIEGVESKLVGINGWYIFNRRRLSYPAVYSHSSKQKKSCGSIMIGASYTLHEFKMDADLLPEMYQEHLSDGLRFDKLSYHNISLGVGYTYNFAFGKNFTANITVLPSIGYKISKIRKEDTKDPIYKNLQFDVIGKTGITYNDRKYFAGCTLQLRAFANRKESFSMVNSLGSLTFFVGFNFWKRK